MLDGHYPIISSQVKCTRKSSTVHKTVRRYWIFSKDRSRKAPLALSKDAGENAAAFFNA